MSFAEVQMFWLENNFAFCIKKKYWRFADAAWFSFLVNIHINI